MDLPALSWVAERIEEGKEWAVAKARKDSARLNLNIAIQVAIDADPDRADMYRSWQRDDASSK